MILKQHGRGGGATSLAMSVVLTLLTLSLQLSPPGASAPNASERPPRTRASPPRLVQATAASKRDVFNSPNWPALLEQLNRLPTFTVANERGQPLQARANTCSVLPATSVLAPEAIPSHTHARLRSMSRRQATRSRSSTATWKLPRRSLSRL
jgi:hypothetical protein